MAYDDVLTFGTEIDGSGFTSGLNAINNQATGSLNKLDMYAANVAANITSSIINSVTSAISQIPQKMVEIGSQFESSMSQVAATMGISTASAEFEQLSEAAREAGETTKFTASQAGEALNYLALAGYNAEKACAALPTVLNLAAAGGMELGRASDMVTDSMSALGLSMGELESFSDKLARTAQRSNTDVSQLGEAILTLGATGRQVSGGVTEINTVLGVLADNGIKGAEGGTALRNILTSLSAPTKKAREELDALGVSAYDDAGKLRALPDIFADLKAALEQLPDSEKNAALKTIFNKYDLAAANNLLGTSAERFEELAREIENSNGAAQEMSDTMNDNLAGDITICQSALEGLAVTAEQKFNGAMREAVQAVTGDIGELTKQLKNGELGESADKLAESFSKLLVSGTDVLANDVIPAVVSGINYVVDHGEEILELVKDIGIAFLGWKATVIIPQIVMGLGSLTSSTGAAVAGAAALGIALKNWVIEPLGDAYIAAKNAEFANSELTQSYIDALMPLEDCISAFEDTADEIDRNITTCDEYYGILEHITDEEGNVTGEMETAQRAVDALNSIMGTHMEIINGQVKGYEDLADAVDNYIHVASVEAKMDAIKPAYGEALLNVDKDTGAMNTALDQWNSFNRQKDMLPTLISNFKQRGSDTDIEALRKKITELGLKPGNYISEGLFGELKLDEKKLTEDINSRESELSSNYQLLKQTVSDENNIISKWDELDKEKQKGASRTSKVEPSNTASHEQEKGLAKLEKNTAEAEISEEERGQLEKQLKQKIKDIKNARSRGEIASDDAMYDQIYSLLQSDEYKEIYTSDTWSDAMGEINKHKGKKSTVSTSTVKKSAETDPFKAAFKKAYDDNKQKMESDESYSEDDFYNWLGEELRSDERYDTSEYTSYWREVSSNSEKQQRELEQEGKKSIDELIQSYKDGDTSFEDLSEMVKVLADDYSSKSIDLSEYISDKMPTADTVGLKAIETQEKYGIIDAQTAYEKRLEWAKKYPEAAAEVYDEVYKYQKEMDDKALAEHKQSLNEKLDAVNENAKAITDTYKKAYSQIESDRKAYKTKLLSIGGDAFGFAEEENRVTHKNEKKFQKNKNIGLQLKKMRRFHELVKSLKTKGAPQSLIAELLSINDVDEALTAVKAVSGSNFNTYKDFYTEKERLAEELSNDLYSEDIKELNDKYASDIAEAYKGLPEEFRAIGEEMGTALKDGLEAGLSDLSDVVNAQIKGSSSKAKKITDKMTVQTAAPQDILSGSVPADSSVSGRLIDVGKQNTLAAAAQITPAAVQTAADMTALTGFIMQTAASAFKDIKLNLNINNSVLMPDNSVLAKGVNNYNTKMGEAMGI